MRGGEGMDGRGGEGMDGRGGEGRGDKEFITQSTSKPMNLPAEQVALG